MLAPIPLSLLPDTALVKVPAEGDYGGEYAPDATISHVRFDSTSALRVSEYVSDDGAQGVLYVDAANSGGAFAIPEGSLVSVDGGKTWMAALSVSEYMCFGGAVHHWEVELR